MEDHESLAVARIVHLLGVILWIGGVGFVTTVLIPALRRLPDQRQRMELFEVLEGRFGNQARVVTLLTGLSGFYMLDGFNAWQRLQQGQFWWLHMMILVWGIFSLVLFVLEPLVLHRWFHRQAAKDSARSFRLLQRMHWVLLLLSLVTVAAAVGGLRGLSF